MTFKQYITRTVNKLRVHLGALPGNLLSFIIDSVLVLTVRAKKHVSSDKVLVIRLDAIGDFVLWTQYAKALRKIYPSEKYKLILLGNRLWSELATDFDVFDEVLPLNTDAYKTKIKYHWQMAKKIRSGGFGIALHPAYSRLFALGDSIIRISGAKEKTGFAGDNSVELPVWKTISNRWYSNLFFSVSKELNELERNAEFLNKLGLKNFQPVLPSLEIKGDLPGYLKGKKYYILFPGAAVGRRQWETFKFAEIAEMLNEKTGWTGVICGGPSEKILGEELIRTIKSPVMDFVGKTSLDELITIIGNSQMVIANETSAVHIAAATGVKSVCLLGGGHYGRFVPYPSSVTAGKNISRFSFYKMPCYGCDWKCIYQVSKKYPAPCVSNITVDNTWEIIEELLNGKS